MSCIEEKKNRRKNNLFNKKHCYFLALMQMKWEAFIETTKETDMTEIM